METNIFSEIKRRNKRQKVSTLPKQIVTNTKWGRYSHSFSIATHIDTLNLQKSEMSFLPC